MYSSNDFNSFEISTPAELLNQPLASAVLQIRKALPRKVPISEFEFIDHPGNTSIDQALKELYAIDAIDTMGQLTGILLRLNKIACIFYVHASLFFMQSTFYNQI